MNQTVAHALIVLCALLLANLPFVSNRLFGVVRLAAKPGMLRVVELSVGYLLTGLVGVLLEGSLGVIHQQSWEFYALTACLFVVFSFPGFVYRFLWRFK